MSCQVIEGVNADHDYELQPYAPETANLSQRIQSDLWNGQYECAICTEGISPDSPLWSCKNCYYAFHFPCLNSWAGSSASGEWFCPTCKDKNQDAPEARCWCARMRHKDLEIRNGNSCQAVCGRSVRCGAKEKPCQGTCRNLCHPGPCELPEKCSMLCLKGVEGDITVQATTNFSPEAPFPSVGQRIHVTESAYTSRYPSRNTRIQDNHHAANASRYAAPQPAPAPNNQAAAEAGQNADLESSFGLALFMTIIEIGVQYLIVVWGLSHTKWWNKPLKYRHFTEKLQTSEFALMMILSIILIMPLLFLIQGAFFMAVAPWLKKVLGIQKRNGESGWKGFLRFIVCVLVGSIAMAGWGSFIVFFAAGPRVGWYNQMHSSCEGFDTRIKLDKNEWNDHGSANSIFLYNPSNGDNQMQQVAGIDHFNLGTAVNRNIAATEPFYSYHYLTGTLSHGHHLAVDFDLQHCIWRISSLNYNGTFPDNSTQARTLPVNESKETVIRNGTWNPTTKQNPHLRLDSLGLQIPNMHYFTKNCQYQSFMTVFRTDHMNGIAIRKQSDTDWQTKSADNVVMRTASFGHEMSALQVCAKREDYLIKTKRGAGVEKRKGLGDDVIVPLGLMAAMRRQMGDKLKRSGCSQF